MLVRFKGHTLPLGAVGRAFIKAWEQSEKLHLKQLMFRIPVVYDPPTPSGFVREHDYNQILTNELVYRILKMPSVGQRKSFVEAWEELSEECFNGDELVSFDPLDQDMVEWAQKKGYYIEFDDLEIVNEACAAG